MKLRLLTCLSTILFAAALHAQNTSPVRLDALATEHFQNPIGIGVTTPRLTWKILSNRTGEVQTAYQVRAATSAAGLEAPQPNLWDSGKVASDQSVLVPWAGKALGSRSQAFWQVRVWDKDGQPSAWSSVATFELGLLNPAADWKGQWITADLPRFDIERDPLAKAMWINGGSTASQGAGIRITVDLPANAKIHAASLDAAADGLLSLYVNGKPTKQGASSHTAPFHVDFGPHVQPGKNTIAIGALPVRQFRGAGGRNAIAAHVVIELEDGKRIDLNTDGAWKAAIVTAPPAARRGAPAAAATSWFDASFDDTAWTSATVIGPYNESAPVASADSTIGPGRYVRKAFTVKGPVANARYYSTAFGAYEGYINGKRINDHQLDPGFTDYNKRVIVQTTDVTNLLVPGKNAMGALVSDGWFAGRVGWMGLYQYRRIGTVPLFNGQLEINYTDGTTDVIATDPTWKGGPGEVVGADEQLGQVIDGRKALPWTSPTFDDSAWAPVTTQQSDNISAVFLGPQVGPPVRTLLELVPKKITQVGKTWVVDFGQNMVGHIRLAAQGPAGTTINVSHAEMLNQDSTLYIENLRQAISLDTFILKGATQKEVFEPTFTFHGFRYVVVSGYPGTMTPDDIRGIVVGSDSPSIGNLDSSSADLNQLFSNIVWGQRGNFLSVPTDCPQRDERLGWMGDAQVFAPTAARNADVSGFFTKWMMDVNEAQTAAGGFAKVSPTANQADVWPVWGDAGVIIPWTMYSTYGDKEFLAANYPYMTRWVNYLYQNSTNLIPRGSIGDHLAPRPTSVPLVVTAYFANSTRIVAQAAAILGRKEDAEGYSKLHQSIVEAFNANFVSPNGTVLGDTQTGYIMALQFDLLPEALRPLAAAKLAANVEQNAHLTTGFIGSGLLCPALTQIGRSDLAWQLVFTDTYPSWLFSVKNGATTIWERWDGWTPQSGYQNSDMNSFNHYSFGAVGYWLFSSAAGIALDPASPGYKHFLLQPQFTAKLDRLKATYDSPYGTIASAWTTEGDQLRYDVTIPPNSSAQLTLPVPFASVQQNGVPAAIANAPQTGSTTTLNLAAGTYRFAFPKALVK